MFLIHNLRRNSMEYTRKNDKFIVNKDGVYFAMTREQVVEMARLCMKILLDSDNDSPDPQREDQT